MFCLFLDLSRNEGVFALFQNEHLMDELRLPLDESRQHCHHWQTLLVRHHLLLSDIAYFSCAVGPGSFTGVRSAVATAKAVACMTGKPLIPVSSLLAFVPIEIGTYQIVVDQKAGVYHQVIQHTHDTVSWSSPEACRWEDLKRVPHTSLVFPEGKDLPQLRETSNFRTQAAQSHLFAKAAYGCMIRNNVDSPHHVRVWYGSRL
jgi:tRNA A37 threonylcarbamoyladenosine modification protein TsaB